jgi:acylphosphatase
MSDEKEALHATIRGRVQGVGFRYFVRENAEMLGVTGWVRNRFDGAVETVAEGQRERLDQFLGMLNQGPRGSVVESIEHEFQDAGGDFAAFKIRLTK